MRRLFAFVLIAVLAVSAVQAQISPEKARKSRELLLKMRQMDMLNYLVPLVMTKDQVRKLLPVIEKARRAEFLIEEREHSELLERERRMNEALDNGIKKGEAIDREFLNELAKLYNAFLIRRQIMAEENTDAVTAALKEILNPGQLAAARNTLEPRAFDPKLDPKTMTDEQKLRFFVKWVLLEDAAYQVLVRMSQ